MVLDTGLGSDKNTIVRSGDETKERKGKRTHRREATNLVAGIR
jgi:hypothetical protein